MNLLHDRKFPFCSAARDIDGMEAGCDGGDIKNAIAQYRSRPDGTTGAKLPTRSRRGTSGTNSLASGPRIVVEQCDPISLSDGGLRVFRHFQLGGRDSTMIDLLEVRNAQAQLPRCRDMSGPAIEQILTRIVEELVIIRGDVLRITIPY